ncbi:MAG: HD domain-containing protein [Erysipelotrichaceae bacterium]
MSKTIEEFIDGDKLTIKVLIHNVTRGVTNKGAPYLSFVLQDKSGTMDAKFWNVSEEMLGVYKAGMLVEVNGDVLSHNKQLQFRIQSMNILDRSSVDLRDYIKASPIPRAVLKEKIEEHINAIKNEKIKTIVQALINEYETDFYAYPAASKNHHDFVGGLATHVLGMIELAKRICALYPLLNQDLLVGGVLVHDLGKLIELSGPVITEYTLEGKLLGHISIMQAKLTSVASEQKIEGEEVTLLRHMILSHHGVYEYGSPVLPMIPEAEILYFIDNMDARMNTMEKALNQVEPGEFTPRIFALENRMFYKSKLVKE